MEANYENVPTLVVKKDSRERRGDAILLKDIKAPFPGVFLFIFAKTYPGNAV